MKQFVVICVLLLGMLPAHAFQETEVPVTDAPVEVARSPQSVERAELQLPDAGAETKTSKGTSIRIPGLGEVGTLPKLNFGLELLYGGEEERALAEQDRGDVSIKGRLKHKF